MATEQFTRRLLRRLEIRLLTVLLSFGAGRLAGLACGLLLGLYLTDRSLEPPLSMRWLLLGLCVALFLLRFRQWLWTPLHKRPSAKELAKLWERSHPELGGLLSTAIEVSPKQEGISKEMLDAVKEQAKNLELDFDASIAAPGGLARRSAVLGALSLICVFALTWWQPTESSIFLARLQGKAVAWPHDTRLILLPPSLNPGESLDGLGEQNWQLQVTSGAPLAVRIRAEGEVPEFLEAKVNQQNRRLRHIGGGEFILNLPPINEELRLEFRGGDDQDGSPFLHLIPGSAPSVSDWAVRETPPAYTGLAERESTQHEFQSIEKSLLSVSFKIIDAKSVSVQRMNGELEELTPSNESVYIFEQLVVGTGECSIQVVGNDGFQNHRAAVLSWRAIPDNPPQLQILHPRSTWNTTPGGVIPISLTAIDDYGIQHIRFSGFEEFEFSPTSKPTNWSHFLSVPTIIPEVEGSAEETLRHKFEFSALDYVPPAGQLATTASPWIEVLPSSALQQRHLERVVRVREQVNSLLALAEDLASGRQNAGAGRRLYRRMNRITFELEQILMERIYSQLDSGGEECQSQINNILAKQELGSGDVVEALRNTPAPGRSALLFDLSLVAHQITEGPAKQTANKLARGEDATQTASQTVTQLKDMLNIMLEWEDFQSAVNLLRDLLERQRNLHLRTRDAAND